MRRLFAIMMASAALLTACAPNPPPPAPLTPNVIEATLVVPPQAVEGDTQDLANELQLGQPAGGFFSVTLTGAAEGLFAGAGRYICVGDVEQLSVTNPATVIVFGVPPDAATGEITIDSSNPAVTVAVLLDEVGTVDEYFGIFTLDDVPGAAGDPVRGSFDITLLTASGDTINAAGSFDVTAARLCS